MLELINSNLEVKYIKESYTLTAGETKQIFSHWGKGVLEHLMIASNNKDVRGIILTDGHQSSYTYAEAYDLGLVFPAGQSGYLTIYDDTNNVYNIIWAPVPAWEFKHQFEVKIKNEGTTTATVTLYLLIWMKGE